MQGFLSVCRIISRSMKITRFTDWRYNMKRIIAITTALVFMLSAGTTVSAAHHIPCIGRMLQSGAFCQNGENCDIEHHWFRHGGGEGGCFWNVDIQGTCDRWESCHGVYGTPGAYDQSVEEGVTQDQPAQNALPQAPDYGTLPQNGVQGNQAQESGQSSQTAGEAPAAGTYDGGAGSAAGYGNQTAGYGNGGYYGGGCHTSGHHGSGRHGHH